MKLKLILAIILGFTAPCLAQTQWPPEQVTIMVPFAAGSTPDSVARIMADKLAERTKKTFVVENRPGAGGNLGVAAVAKGPADGSVIGVAIMGALGLNKFLMKSMPYDPDKDIAIAAMLVEQPSALAVSNEMGVSSVQELVAKLAKNPDTYNYSSIGQGSLSHLAMELLAMKSGAKVMHLAMKSSPEAAMAVMRNDVQMTVLPLVSVLQLAQEGKLKMLAVTSDKRTAAAPDVPTFKEAGLDVVASAWNAMIAPAATPRAVLEAMNKEANAALEDAAVKDKLAKQVMDITPMSVEQAKAYVASEVTRWGAIVKSTGIEPQ
jgi:tripartite-type tricarboxylate transporter receptor subunit TctC